MLLAVLLLSFGVSHAADVVAISVYDVTNDVVLNPATDTIYTLDADGNPLSYQMWIGLENSVDLGGLSLGFRISSTDGVIWQYDAQPDGISGDDNLAAVTVVPGSRMDPHDDVFDLTGLLVTDQDTDGALDDLILFGGVSLFASLPIGPMQNMIALHFTPGGVVYPEVKSMCFDSTFIPPSGNFVFVNTLGSTFPPTIGPAVCFPVASLDVNAADGENPVVPYTFDLGQNYPNPFNPVTVIAYSVARKTNVNISVFNILGQKVATLVDGEVLAGPQEARWEGVDDNGDNVASGIYFYKMVTDDFVETRKMALMR
jgi:hypothetical protein